MSTPVPSSKPAFTVSRGAGIGGQREGLLYQNVLATYTHIHALGCPQWAAALVRRAREYHGDADLEENSPPPKYETPDRLRL